MTGINNDVDPDHAITFEHLMDQTAITYPYVTVSELSGETIKTILEDVADNLFNPDPYYQQRGDMVRVGGISYAIAPPRSTCRRSKGWRAIREIWLGKMRLAVK